MSRRHSSSVSPFIGSFIHSFIRRADAPGRYIPSSGNIQVVGSEFWIKDFNFKFNSASVQFIIV